MQVRTILFQEQFDPNQNEILTTPKYIAKNFKPSKKIIFANILVYIIILIAAASIVCGIAATLITLNLYYLLLCSICLISFSLVDIINWRDEMVETEVEQLDLFAAEKFDAEIDKKFAENAAEEWRKDHPLEECLRLYKTHNPLFVPAIIQFICDNINIDIEGEE